MYQCTWSLGEIWGLYLKVDYSCLFDLAERCPVFAFYLLLVEWSKRVAMVVEI